MGLLSADAPHRAVLWLTVTTGVFWAPWLLPRHPTFADYAYRLVPLTALALLAGLDKLAENRQPLVIGGWVASLLL